MIRIGTWKGFRGVWAEGGVSAGVAIGGGRTWLASGEYVAVGGVRLDDGWGDWYWLELDGRYGRRVHATAYAVGDDGW
ncbi:MAG TPA: hypothetical protein VJ578_04715 [Dehalococcoidia bacterium]|nr:hypothetical protein [Dehalococcoidia bacterium]